MKFIIIVSAAGYFAVEEQKKTADTLHPFIEHQE